MRELEDILVDYFAGDELSPEESRVLVEWLEQGNHREIITALQGMHAGAGIRKSLRQDPGSGMSFIRYRIGVVQGKRRFFYWSVAACLFMLLGPVVLHFGNFGNGSASDGVITSGPVAGKSYAQLKLADGKEIPLYANRDEMIIADSFMSVENMNKTLVYRKNKINEKIEYNTLTVPLGAEYNVVLADGTKIYLNAGTLLRYPVVFSGNTREVYLEGEGYFEVAKDSTKRFEVHTPEMTAVVLGTSFNVKSYADQDHAAATLEEGHLKIVCGNRAEYDVYPGHQVRYDKSTREAAMKKVDTKYYTSWKDGYYSFNEMSLEEVMEILSKWYNLNVFYVDDEVKEIEFSGRLKRYDDFSYLLGKFEETGAVEFIIKDKTVTVKKK